LDNPLYSFNLWAGLLGGMALFLFGMDVMTQALKSAAGDYMKDMLRKLTRNRFMGVGLGAFVTAIIQSSSVTTVILVGFISAGLMSMSQSVAVILGANIGTTITAQILAFKVSKIALPMIALGFAISLSASRNSRKQLGLIILGLGLVFYGMFVMSDAMSPLRSYEPFVQFMISMDNPLLAAAIGALFTALVQSSSATTGIMIAMASQGLIGLESAIAIALGANVGTCVTAGIASINKPREAVRAALVHALFNIAGVTLWIFFIPQLAELAQVISPVYPNLSGTERMAAETPRQIANVHTFFNVINALVFVGFTTQFARLVEWLIPDKPIAPDAAMRPKYLDKSLISTPSIALETVRLELVRMGEKVVNMVSAIIPVALTGTRSELEQVAKMDKVVDALHIAIIEYLGKISLSKLSKRQSDDLMLWAQLANDLEHIGDRVATGMVTSAQKRIDEEVHISPETAQILSEYHAVVNETLKDALHALSEKDTKLAKSVGKRKKTLSKMSKQIVRHGMGRLTADAPNRLHTYAREMEVMELLDSLSTIVQRIARLQIDGAKHADEEALAEPA
jgi:phosphate:Na+ symporter